MKNVYCLAIGAFVLVSASACEDRRDKAPGQTTTTSAERDLEQAGQKAGKEIGSAADKAAEEARRAAERLDRIKIDVSLCDGCDGGARRRD
jgi:hypothetical protein